MQLQTIRCDSCLVQSSVPVEKLGPEAGWVRLIFVRSIDPREAAVQLSRRMQHEVQRVAEDVQDAAAEARADADDPLRVGNLFGSIMGPIAERIASGSIFGGPPRPPAIDLCPACAETLSITVRGESILSAMRRQERE